VANVATHAIKNGSDTACSLTEAFIEKDYYVTEALRIVANQWQNQVIFKGETSLSNNVKTCGMWDGSSSNASLKIKSFSTSLMDDVDSWQSCFKLR
jgi:hypothetical protein